MWLRVSLAATFIGFVFRVRATAPIPGSNSRARLPPSWQRPIVLRASARLRSVISVAVAPKPEALPSNQHNFTGEAGQDHDGNCGCDALCATVVGSRWEPSGESQLRRLSDRLSATTRVGQAVWLVETHTREIGEGWR